MVHGRTALAALVRRGCDEGSPMALLLREREKRYLADLPDVDAASEVERSLCRRLAILDLDMGLLNAKVHTPDGERVRRIGWAKLLAVTHARADNTRTFAAVASKLGIQRRPKDVTPTMEELLADEEDGGA